MLFWIVTLCRLIGRFVSEKHTVSIFRNKDGSVPNEIKVVGNRSAQFLVAAVDQQSFHVTVSLPI
jgi:hypothetical protein